MTEKFNVRSEILSAIGKTDDPNMKMILLLMLGVLEEIGGRLEDYMSDDKTMRDKVLNGHESRHHVHHDHIEACIAAGCIDMCRWAKAKQAEEMEARNDRRSLARKFAESIVAQAGTIITTALLTGLGVMFLGK